MKTILNFLIEVHKLRNVQRKGITFYGVKKADSALDHSFRMALLVALLARERNLNSNKALRMALIHDIAKVHAGDITPYDGLLPNNKKARDEFVKRWRRLSLGDKAKMNSAKFQKEQKALKTITAFLPKQARNEIRHLWLDYNHGKSKEAKFVQQVDVVENLLEAFEWWLKNKDFPTMPWWEHAIEVVDDPVLLELTKEIAKAELNEICKNKK